MDPKLSDQQIADMREQEIISPAISDLYSALNQPVEQKGRRRGVSYEAGGEQQETVGPAPSETAPEPEPAAQPRSEQQDSDQTTDQPAEPQAYLPVSPKDRRGIDWVSAMAPISDAMYDAASWFKDQAEAPVPDTSHSGRSAAWRSLGETLGAPIDRYIEEHDTDGTGAYVPDLTHSGRIEAWRSIGEALGAPIDRHWDDVQNYRYEGPAGDKALPTAEPGSMMSEAGRFDESTRISPLQNAVDSAIDRISDHWDDVQNYSYEGPAGDRQLPTVDQWTQMSDAGQLDESPRISPLQNAVDRIAGHWNDVQNYRYEGPSGEKDLPTVEPGTMMSEAGRFDESPRISLSEATGLYIDPDMVGRTEQNESYEDFFIANGADADDVRAMANRDDFEILSSIGMGGPREYNNSTATGDASVIDDGTSYDYDHATSNWMSGTQYKRYREELGIPGRPIDDIIPTNYYNKQEELIDYGFIPYTPDWMSAIERNGANLMMAPGRAAGWIGNMREHITPDYTINYDGKSISGRDFDQKITPYIQQNIWNSQYNPMKYLVPPEGGNGFTAYVNEWSIPSDDGTITYHYGDPQSIDESPDGSIIASFSDGSTVTLPSELSVDEMVGLFTNDNVRMVRADRVHGTLPDDLSALNDVPYIMNESRRSGISPLSYANVLYYPDLVLSDGTSVSYEDAQRIYYDETPEDDPSTDDDGISYGFSERLLPFLFDNKPARFNAQEMIAEDENGNRYLDLSDVGNNAVDFTAGSLPISMPGAIPWIFSLPSAIASLAGVDPSSYDSNSGSYLPIAGYYDDNGNMRYGVQALMPEGEDWMALDPQLRVDRDMSDRLRYWNALGNAAVPFTEQIAGSVGGSDLIGNILGVSDEAMEKIVAPSVGRLALRDLYGPVGEGFEEISGNHFDELTNYGLRGMWADQAMDTEGRPMYDVVGREIRDYSTPLSSRVSNALDPTTMGNAFAGGVLVSGVMGAPGLIGKPAEYANARRRRADYVANGVAPYVEPDEVEAYEPSEEYLSQFDDRPAMRMTR